MDTALACRRAAAARGQKGDSSTSTIVSTNARSGHSKRPRARRHARAVSITRKMKLLRHQPRGVNYGEKRPSSSARARIYTACPAAPHQRAVVIREPVENLNLEKGQRAASPCADLERPRAMRSRQIKKSGYRFKRSPSNPCRHRRRREPAQLKGRRRLIIFDALAMTCPMKTQLQAEVAIDGVHAS